MTITATYAYGGLTTLKEVRDFNGDGVADTLYAFRNWQGQWTVQFTNGANGQVSLGNLSSSFGNSSTGAITVDLNGDNIADTYEFDLQNGQPISLPNGGQGFSFTNADGDIVYGVNNTGGNNVPPWFWPPGGNNIPPWFMFGNMPWWMFVPPWFFMQGGGNNNGGWFQNNPWVNNNNFGGGFNPANYNFNSNFGNNFNVGQGNFNPNSAFGNFFGVGQGNFNNYSGFGNFFGVGQGNWNNGSWFNNFIMF